MLSSTICESGSKPLLTVARWKTRPPATHTTTRPDASAKAGGGLAHTHRPMRRLLNTTPCCARAASCIPCLLRCNALLQQQITIAATLLSITPHNTPASRASAFAEQTPALPPTNRHAALSDAPGRNALLFALLHADHVFQHFVKLAAQRHPRVDHPPRHDFRARFRARVHHDHLTPRALCPLQPVRQQTIHNIHDLLLIVHNVSHRASSRSTATKACMGGPSLRQSEEASDTFLLTITAQRGGLPWPVAHRSLIIQYLIPLQNNYFAVLCGSSCSFRELRPH